MTALEIKLAIALAAVISILAILGFFAKHERDVGEQRIEAADKRAEASLRTLTDAQTQHAKELATQAELDAAHEQKTLDNYALAHPVGVIRMCDQDDSGSGVRQASAQNSRTKGASPGSATVPQVPGRSKGPDIGPAVAVILSAAERLAVIDTEVQQRQP